jgi:hypothetical protein
VSQYEGRITITPLKKHYPPDTTACIFWLKNRQPQQWRDKNKSEPTQNGMPQNLVEAIHERAAQKAKANGSTGRGASSALSLPQRIRAALHPIAQRRRMIAVRSMKTRSRSRKTSRRQLIDTGHDKRYVRRKPSGRFKQSVEVGRSLAADRRSKAKTKVKPGQGDRGDIS